MSAIELYNAPQSTCSQKVRLTRAEKGLSFEEHRPELFGGDQLRPEYLKLNPNGVVPTLIDDGTPIIDSSVIIGYLDEVFPSPQLSSERPSYATAFYPGSRSVSNTSTLPHYIRRAPGSPRKPHQPGTVSDEQQASGAENRKARRHRSAA